MNPDSTRHGSLEESDLVIPVVEESARIEKVMRPTARVRVSTEVTDHVERVEADLAREEIEVVRVPMNKPVDAVPPIREEGGTMIYPVVEEVLVVEKRLVLREEVHLIRRRHSEHVQQDVPVRRTEAVVERTRIEREG